MQVEMAFLQNWTPSTYVRVYFVYTNAGLETYPYSPRLVRVTSLLSALGPEVVSKLRHLLVA
jgi:hypothetical protein